MLQVELTGPSYRVPAEFSFTRDGNKGLIKVSKPAVVRLHYRALWPDRPPGPKPVLRRRGAGGSAEVVAVAATAKGDVLEWVATPGEYELIAP